MSFSEGFKKELSSLKKVNQVGKKLSADSKYILYDGKLYAYDKENASVSVSDIYTNHKIEDVMSAFPLERYLIDGDLLYHYTKDGDFISYEETNDGLLLKFSVEEEVREEFDIEEFIKYAEHRGFAKFDIVIAYQKGWESNMDIYNCYLKYIDTLSSIMKTVEESILLKYVNDDHKILKKINHIHIDKSNLIFSKEFSESNKEELLDYDLPVDFKVEDSYIRVMKNMFPAVSSKSSISIELYTDDHEIYDWLVTKTDTDDIVTTTFFKILRM